MSAHPRRRMWRDDEADFLVTTHSTHSIDEQAQALGRTRWSVMQKRVELRGRGLLPPEQRARHRPWSRDEWSELQALVADGMGIREIGRRLNRTPHSIREYLRRAHGTTLDELRHGGLFRVRTLQEVQQLLGVSWSAARRWVDRGWLATRRNASRRSVRRKRGQHYLISDDALLSFLSVVEAWPSYDPAAIADPDWRAAALEARARAAAPVRLTHLADRLGYCRSIVSARWLPSGIVRGAYQIGKAYYVPAEEAERLATLLRRAHATGRFRYADHRTQEPRHAHAAD